MAAHVIGVESSTAKAAFARWNEVNAPRLGAALAFYATLSMAPLLVLCIAIAGWVLKSGQSEVVAQVRNLVGYQSGRVLQDLLLNARHSSGLAALAGLAILLFSASGMFVELHDS